MKRTISSVLCIAILITCLALSLSSCAKLEISTINRLQGKDRAAAVLLRMSLAIGKAGSYTTDSVSDLSVTLTNEKKLTIHAEQSDTIVLDGADTKARHREMTNKVIFDGEQTIADQAVTFADGKLSVRSDSNGVKIFSAADAETAKYFFGEDKDNTVKTDDLDLDDASIFNCGYEEGKGWTISLSGFSGKTLDTFADSLDGLDDYLEGFSLTDAAIEMTVSESFLPSSVSAEYIFGSDDPEATDVTLPTVKSTQTMRDFGKAKVEHDLTGFTDVGDISMLKKIESTLDDAKNADKGSFDLKVRTSSKYNHSTNNYWENDTVSFDAKKPGFTYTVTAETHEKLKITLTYADGTRTQKVRVMPGSQYDGYRFNTQKDKQTEDEAKAFVFGLLCSGNFDAFNISSVSLTNETGSQKTYKLTVGKTDASPFEAALKQYGVSEEDANIEAYFSVVFDGDKFVSVSYSSSCSGQDSNGYEFSITITSKVENISWSNENKNPPDSPETGVEM